MILDFILGLSFSKRSETFTASFNTTASQNWNFLSQFLSNDLSELMIFCLAMDTLETKISFGHEIETQMETWKLGYSPCPTGYPSYWAHSLKGFHPEHTSYLSTFVNGDSPLAPTAVHVSKIRPKLRLTPAISKSTIAPGGIAESKSTSGSAIRLNADWRDFSRAAQVVFCVLVDLYS